MSTFELSWEEYAPRNEEERHRVYRCLNGELTLLATGPDWASAGTAIGQLSEDGEFDGHDCSMGWLDTHGTSKRRGRWIANPFTAGGTR
jgi:hypothetical protein